MPRPRASHRFSQVDVFSTEPLLGNPVAVVHDADDLTDEEMAAFARWTNLSETTFLLAPTDPAADYRLRIFTPGGELPFAGHPTLGSAHAWLEAGGAPAGDGVVQECGAGLVAVARAGDVLAFEAPPLVRSGPVEEFDLALVAAALRLGRADLVDAAWIDNGPGWVGVLLRDAGAVLALDPDFAAFGDLKIGVVGEHPAGGEAAIEVRAFCPQYGVPEDPVTGSLNAGIGQWLAGSRLPASYVAAQGTAVGRRGRVHVARTGGTVHVGGATRTTITGTLDLRHEVGAGD
ncbi:PhzF family phenazine biosynthesis protein [Nocardioides marmotae]|uniref:PhzF family phenazine biosynthesis protein n=1 Tax=Nocardioides marmotae TaxID=2663857 RepID=UPI0013231FB5|nr:PhzF family phenazine biosynthesis protein [Nocardioides marmotae]MBC9733467.1 PhzF family phenazine biosynthesis protein [Nocardioides marmotae]MTB84574.1 PhzF family phenazine biosynthesis isomerase [Nocardioides marmotae]